MAKKKKSKAKPSKASKAKVKKKPVKRSGAAAKPAAKGAAKKSGPKRSWLDPSGHKPLIDQYARQLGTFINTMADGIVDDSEIEAQEKRVVGLMRKIEPRLDADLHEQVTQLLCELTAFDIMQMLRSLYQQRKPMQFRG